MEERGEAEERCDAPGHAYIDERHGVRQGRSGWPLHVGGGDWQGEVCGQGEDEDHLSEVEHPRDDVEPPESAHGGVGATFFNGGGHNSIVLAWSALSHGHARIGPQIYFGRNEKSVVFASSSCAVELSDSTMGTWSRRMRIMNGGDMRCAGPCCEYGRLGPLLIGRPVEVVWGMSHIAAIDSQNLTKSYGKARGIESVTFSVQPGEVMGLVGESGSGKSTFLRALMNFIFPTSGNLSVFGQSVVEHSVEVRRRSTYLPGEFVVPPRLTGHQALRRYAFSRKGMGEERIHELADRLRLDLSRKVGELSKGNKQKVALVLAFAPKADLIVLDEPTSGLDPILQRTFAELVKEVTSDGATVILSSHVMSEVQHIADRVALLRQGKLASVGTVASLLQDSRRRGSVRPEVGHDAAEIMAKLSAMAGASEIKMEDGEISFACHGSVDLLLKLLASYKIESFDLAHADLEDAFFAHSGSEDGS